LDNIDKEVELQEFQKSMVDRFGPMPEEVENLFKIARIRWKAEQIGFEKLTLKNNILKGYFVSQERTEYFQTDKFGKILDYIKNNPKKCLLKEIKSKLLLTVEKVQSIDVLDKLLSSLI
jgi:transcription-repair coupling factor (superfamily II helicase)